MDTQHEEIWNAHRQMVKAHNSTARILAEENRELAQRVEDLEATVRRMAQAIAELQAQAIPQAA
jgi:phosphate uptake regulator